MKKILIYLLLTITLLRGEFGQLPLQVFDASGNTGTIRTTLEPLPASILIYNETETYVIGDAVTVFGITFVNRIAITFAEVFDPLKWECALRDLESGIVTGGAITDVAGKTTFDNDLIQAMFVDNSDPANFLVTPVTIAAANDTPNTLIAGGTTQLLVTIGGTILQQTTASVLDKLTHINLGLIVSDGVVGQFFAPETKVIYSSNQSWRAFMSSIGGQSIQTTDITPGATGLTLNSSGALVLSEGRGTPNRRDLPNVVATSPIPIGDFFKVWITTGDVFNFDFSTNEIDPENYNPTADTLSPVATLQFQIFRVYSFGGSNDKLIYPGRTLYVTKDQARQSFRTSDEFKEHITTFPGAFCKHIIVQQGITDWLDPDTFEFLPIPEGVTGSWDRGIPTGEIGGLTPAQAQSALANKSTGLISGGILTAGTIPATQISQAAGEASITDHGVLPFTEELISWNAVADVDLTTFPGADLTKASIFVFRVAAGALELISSDTQAPTSQQKRDKVFIGTIRTTFGLVANEVRSISNFPLTLNAPINQIEDHEHRKFTTLSGNTIEAANVSVDSTIRKLTGITHATGINAVVSLQDPNIRSVPASADPLSFRYIGVNGEITGTLITVPDTNNYELAGVLTAFAGNNYQIKKVWLDPANDLFYLQYGTATYSAADIDNGAHLLEESQAPALLSNTAYVIARIVIKAGTTNFDGDARNTILQGDGIGGAGAGGGSGITVVDNLLSTDPNAALSANQGRILNGASAGWTHDGTTVKLTNIADDVGIGIDPTEGKVHIKQTTDTKTGGLTLEGGGGDTLRMYLTNTGTAALQKGDNDLQIELLFSGDVQIANQIHILGGVPGSGKVLTSDGVGLGSWETPVPNTNIANTSLTMDGIRFLFMDGNGLFVIDGASPVMTLDPTAVTGQSTLFRGDASIRVLDSGVSLFFDTDDDLRIDNIAGFPGQALTSNGASSSPQWKYLPVVGLPTAIGYHSAYSLRLVNLDYTGALITVRRDSDNTVLGIPANVFGDLDETALLNFVGSGSGFVQTLHDQSGNSRDWIQLTNANQAIIVTSGVVNKINDKPSMEFDGISDNYLRSNAVGELADDALSAFMVVQSDDDGLEGRIFQMDRNTDYFLILREDALADNLGFFSDGSEVTTAYTYAEQNQITFISLSGIVNGTEIFIDGVSGGQVTSTWGSAQVANDMTLGVGRGGTSSFADMHFQELLVYNVDKNAEREVIQTSQNDYWEIGGPVTGGIDPNSYISINGTGFGTHDGVNPILSAEGFGTYNVLPLVDIDLERTNDPSGLIVGNSLVIQVAGVYEIHWSYFETIGAFSYGYIRVNGVAIASGEAGRDLNGQVSTTTTIVTLAVNDIVEFATTIAITTDALRKPSVFLNQIR